MDLLSKAAHDIFCSSEEILTLLQKDVPEIESSSFVEENVLIPLVSILSSFFTINGINKMSYFSLESQINGGGDAVMLATF